MAPATTPSLTNGVRYAFRAPTGRTLSPPAPAEARRSIQSGPLVHAKHVAKRQRVLSDMYTNQSSAARPSYQLMITLCARHMGERTTAALTLRAIVARMPRPREPSRGRILWHVFGAAT